MEFEFCKIEIFLPKTHLAALQEALRRVDAGHVGNYDCCLSYHEVTGCWRPLAGSEPYSGEENEISREAEYKVEVLCRAEKAEQTIRAIKEAHPYERPVINAIPLWRTGF